jgi:hypothetical protein
VFCFGNQWNVLMQKTFVVVILLITALSAGQNVVAEEKAETLGNPSEKKPSRQLVHFAPASEIAVEIERSKDNDGNDVTTVIGRLYVWQKLADADRMLELLADNAVVFSTGETKSDQSLPGGDVRAIYLSGDVVMTEGPRSIRADELYYNFADRTALVINAEMRTFDALRGIPIYLRAAKLRQVSENK